MAIKKGLFKSKGTGILKKPESMAELLNEIPGPIHYSKSASKLNRNKIKTQAPKLDVQMHTTESEQDPPDVRLHVFIRGDLDDKLLDEVNRRKKDKFIPNNQANKRTVVEVALEKFL